MTTLQEYLNKKYPTPQEKERVKEITVGWYGGSNEFRSNILTEGEAKKLEGGQLDLSQYTNLEKVVIDGKWLKSQLTSLNISKRNRLFWLDCSNNHLTNLDLSDCSNLEEVRLYYNQITSLNVTNCGKVRKLGLSYNQLTDLSFLTDLQAYNMTGLYIGINNFPEQDLSIFSRFKNLECLCIGTTPFFGSLAPLHLLNKLNWLDIENTDLVDGLGCLPDSLEKLHCNGKLAEGLDNYKGGSDHLGPYYDYQAWKKANPDLIIACWKKETEQTKGEVINKNQRIAELEEEVQMEREEAKKALEKAKEWRERQIKEITVQKNKEIEELRAENTRLQQLTNQQSQIQQVSWLPKR